MSRYYKTGGQPLEDHFARPKGETIVIRMISRLSLGALTVVAALTAANAESVCELSCSRITDRAGGGGQQAVATLAWLSGDWIQDANGTVVRERWSGPYGDMLLGIGVTLRPQNKSSFEFFRIANTPTGVSYFASPNARPAVEFKAIELTPTKVVFENKTHDFPQRVIYWRENDGLLHARVEGALKGKLESEEWTYRPER